VHDDVGDVQELVGPALVLDAVLLPRRVEEREIELLGVPGDGRLGDRLAPSITLVGRRWERHGAGGVEVVEDLGADLLRPLVEVEVEVREQPTTIQLLQQGAEVDGLAR
jgi:hypothetical protein